MRTVILVAVFFSVVVVGCGVYTTEPYIVRDFEVGRIKEATVGSVMMAWETGTQELQYKKWLSRKSGLRKELVYGGIAQGVVQISYREYAVSLDALGRGGTYARPSFSQDLKYDLSLSKEIAFRDLKIRVESTDQSKIVFTLLQEPSETKEATPQDETQK